MAKRISFRLSDAVEGGIFDDFDGVIEAIEAVMTGYPNKEGVDTVDPPIPAVKLTINNPEAKEPLQQIYSIGSKRSKPTKDKRSFEDPEADEKGDDYGISKSSNFYLFLSEALSCGLITEAQLGDDLTFLVGMQAHFNQKALPKRRGDGPDTKAKTLLVPTGKPRAAIKAAGKATGKAGITPAAAPAASGAGDEELVAAALEATLNVLGEKQSLSRDTLAVEVLRKVMKHKDRARIVGLVKTDEYLLQEGVPWTFDGQTVSMG